MSKLQAKLLVVALLLAPIGAAVAQSGGGGGSRAVGPQEVERRQAVVPLSAAPQAAPRQALAAPLAHQMQDRQVQAPRV